MIIKTQYTTIYALTFIGSIIKAILIFATMVGYIGMSEIAWLLVFSAEPIILMVFVVNYDSRFPANSPNHNVYRIYVISLLAMILVVWMFLIFAAYGLIVPEVALMTYLFFCLPIWLTLSVSFYELQKAYLNK